MKTISLIILTGFISLSLFGFVGMLDGTMHGQSGCIASRAQNGACPPLEHTLASAFFHTSALKVFSTALLSLAALISLALLFAGILTPLPKSISLGAHTLARRIEELISEYLALQKLRLALARFEHSPTSL